MLDKLVRWTPQRRQHWEAIRTAGKRHFVVWHGIMRYGGFMYAFMTIVMLAQNSARLKSLLDIGVLLAIGAVVWPLAGIVVGVWMWSMMETAYTRYQQQQRNE
jgi:hypothetical protein